MMKRRDILIASATALMAPSLAKASAATRRRGDGYTTIPYVPQDAIPYFTPGPDLDANMRYIDPEIRSVVKKINRSGWVWTAESCQGHPSPKSFSRQPMLRLVCRADDLSVLLASIYKSALTGSEITRGRGLGTRLRIERHRPAPAGWTEFRLYASSMSYFERLARNVSSS